MNFETWLQSDLTKPLKVQTLHGLFFSADNAANLIGAEVFNGGVPAALSGTCIGYAIRSDGGTLAITGTVSGNKASIILPTSAYVIEGALDIVIKVVSGSVKTTVGACRGYVQRATTDTIIDPGHVIPSMEELLALIEPMEQGTDAANAAAASANTAATNANNKANVANTAATNANNAASTANTAATNANTARDNANAAAAAANAATAAAPTQISSQETAYANSTSGTTVPADGWQSSQPTTPQGQYLWIRKTLTWDNGETTTLYSVSRMGVDGSGSVVSVNSLSPDANGNVDLGAIVHKVNNVSPDSSGNVALPIDAAPTDGSSNPVSSDGVYDAMAGKQDTLTFDDAPTAGSSNPVKSGGTKAALDGKVSKDGDTIIGTLILTSNTDYPTLAFNRHSDPSNGPQQMIQANEAGALSRLSFFQRVNDDGAWEGFRLPSTTEVLTSGNVYYDILTTKPGSGSLYYAPGETYSNSADMMINGYITNGVRNIHLGLWLPKSLEKISSISITSLVGSMRGVNGYINGWNGSTNILTQSGITVITSRTTPNGIHINIGSNSDLSNTTANTPVSFGGRITLSFS